MSLLSSVSLLPTFFLLQRQKSENTSEGHREEVEVLQKQLREREETVQDLKNQLAVAEVNLKDAEIKYATQVQKLFSIHHSVFPTSLLRLVWQNRTMITQLVFNSLTSILSVLCLLKSPRSIHFTAIGSSSKHYLNLSHPQMILFCPSCSTPGQTHPWCRRCSEDKRWVSPLDNGMMALWGGRNIPGRAWIGCPFLWVRIWALPCLPFPLCVLLWACRAAVYHSMSQH